MRRWVLALGLLVAGIAVWVWAGADPPLQYPELTASIVARIDTDGDGCVQAEEYDAVRMPDEPLATLDLDADGELCPYEIETFFLKTDPSRVAARRLEQLQDLRSVRGAR